MKADYKERAETAEADLRTVLRVLKEVCHDDFVVITDGTIDWRGTVYEFASFMRNPRIDKVSQSEDDQ